MRILAFGDTHGNEKILKTKLNDIDLVLISGDIEKSDTIRKYHFKYSIKKNIRNWKELLTKRELKKLYMEAITSAEKILKHFSKNIPTFFVFGNILEVDDKHIKNARKKYNINVPLFGDRIIGCKNLKDISFKVANFNGLKIAGIPYYTSMDWIKTFSPNNETLKKQALKDEQIISNFIKKLSKVDILVTHIPPYGILDVVNSPHVPKVWKGKHAGSKAVLAYIKNKKPRLVLCGHIHEAKGIKKVGNSIIVNTGANGDYCIIDIKDSKIKIKHVK